eukprot:6457012-Amphidinium_carterae.1
MQSPGWMASYAGGFGDDFGFVVFLSCLLSVACGGRDSLKAKFQKICQAYEVLSEESRREMYDRTGSKRIPTKGGGQFGMLLVDFFPLHRGPIVYGFGSLGRCGA